MLMPRRFEAVRLVPGPQIDIVDADCLSYKASAAQPYFEVFAENENQSAGWFFLEMSLVRFGGNRIANLYWDAGRGYCKDDSIFIPSNRRGSIGEVVFLPHGLSKLRWSPMETGGRFNQSPLIVHRISAFESYFRRAWRVGFDLWNFRALSLQERDGIDWFSLLLNLKKAYTPYALLHHHESVSRGQENTPEKQARFLSEVTFMQKKWGDIVKVDPYYNPNLILTAENFSLANHAVRSSHHGYPLDV